MAPLKHPGSDEFRWLAGWYPWLKGHGSFEAVSCFFSCVELVAYPWLKGHGSFEAPAYLAETPGL